MSDRGTHVMHGTDRPGKHADRALLAGCSSESSAADANPGHSVQASGGVGAAAEQREAVFSLTGMNCPLCGPTVKRALSGVDGVSEAEASFRSKEVRALFDPKRSDTDALMAAIEKAGFSGRLKESEHE